MSIRKHFGTREDLDNNRISVEGDENGQPIIIQDLPPKTGRGKKGKKIRNTYVQVKSHLYGSDYSSCFVFLKFYDKTYTLPTSNVVWIYFNGEIGDYDVDHIDNDTSNNSLSNLQLITHQENLNRRPVKGNQYTRGY